MGFNYLKAESLHEGTLLFTIDLRFPKKVAHVLIVNSEKYNLKNLKNVKNTQACIFTKSNPPLWVFFTFLKLYKWYQIVQNIFI